MKKLASIAAGLLLGSAFAVSGAMAQDVTTITWQMWAGGEEDVAGWQEIADLVSAKYPEIKVELQTAPWGDYWTKLAGAGRIRPDDRHLLAAVAAHAELPSADGAAERLHRARRLPDRRSSCPRSSRACRGRASSMACPSISARRWCSTTRTASTPPASRRPVEWTMDEFNAAAKALTTDGKYGVGVTPGMFAPGSPRAVPAM